MAEQDVLGAASEVPIVRHHLGFVTCDEERLAALREAEEADSPAAEYEAISVAVHLWQAQQEEVKGLLDRALNETQDGYDAHPFTDWIQRWTEEMREQLPRLVERNNALVAALGKRVAEQIGQERAVPRLQQIQARVDSSEVARQTGVLGDLHAAGRHDELLEPIAASTRPRRDVEIHETDRVRFRPLEDWERSTIEGPYSWVVALLDEAGEELTVFGLHSDQDLSDALHDQFSTPAPLGQLPDGEVCWIYKGRYYLGGPAGLRALEAFKQLEVEPLNEAETRAYLAAHLPPPRSQLERLIAWAHEADDDATFADVLEHIDSERELHEGDAAEWERIVEEMRDDLTRSHEQALLNTSELAQCLQALGLEPSRREAIPESVRHAVWRRDEGRCVQCGSRERLEFDHIVPFSRGGSNTERNLQLLCETCNRLKGATI